MIEYFKEALQGNGYVHAANSELTYALTIADKKLITPPIYDATYIDFLLDYCKENEIKAIISLFDIDLPVLSKNKKLFEEQGITIVVSDFWVTELCNDKWLTYQFLTKNDIRTPRSFISLDDAKTALQAAEITYPLFIKPRWGMGSIGIFEAENDLELEVLYNKTQKAIAKSYLKYESAADISHAVLIQERAKGLEHGIDVLNDLEGNFICTVAKQKIAMRAGETDIAKVIQHGGLESLGNKLSSLLRHIGNLDVDCFLDEGNISVLELNCRFGGQYPFTHLAGANFPAIIVDLLGDSTPQRKDYTVRYNTLGCKELNIKSLI